MEAIRGNRITRIRTALIIIFLATLPCYCLGLGVLRAFSPTDRTATPTATYTPIGILRTDTPTLSPVIFPTATDTPTPTITWTPSMTFTAFVPPTRTPSPSATNTPTPEPPTQTPVTPTVETPTDTLTPP